MNREQLRAMQLAGTVSVPQKFPQLANISFSTNGEEAVEADGGHDGGHDYLAVEHVINAKLRIRRSFRTCDISAIFLPWSCDCVDLLRGDWFLGGEICKALPTALENRGGVARGIAYVPEQVSTLMQVEVGMTAAESVEYYPPLPDDRSIDHYALGDAGDQEVRDPALFDSSTASLEKDPCAAFAQPAEPRQLGKPRQAMKEQTAAGDPCANLFW